jgi:asparagine synthase (glutamine-hydrolysing)
MCGISGVISNKQDREQDIKKVRDMSLKITHRGPDSKSIYSKDNFHLNFNRLSIVDIQNGNQPFYSKKQNIIAWVNGEIYNYREIKENYTTNYNYQTRSDCEVVVPLYEKYGIDFVKYLRGMFLVVILDLNKKEVFFIRDRIGEKPLYFAKFEKKFVFASELKCFSAFKDLMTEINHEAIYEFLLYQYFIEPKTPFKNIVKIPSGSYLNINLKNLNFIVKEYWSMDKIKAVSSNKPFEEIKKKLVESVLLTSNCNDKPVSVSLSGGVDSSLICSILKKNNIDFTAYTAGYKDFTKNDERKYARAFSKKEKFNFQEIIIDSKDVANNFLDLCYNLDEPIADISSYTYYLISKNLKKKKIKVLLQGHGIDELFWGYDHVKRSVLGKQKIRDRIFNMFYKINNKDFPNFNLLNKDFVYASKYINNFLTEKYRSFQNKDFINSFYKLDKEENESVKITKLIIKSYLLSNGINQSEKLGMSNSVELRLPFVDYKLIETVIGLRKSGSLGNDHELKEKFYFKKSVKDILPSYILKRKKRGFSPPAKKWFKEIFNQHGKLIKNGYLKKFGILDNKNYLKLIKGPKIYESFYSNTPISFKFLILEIWFKNFYER